MHPAWFQSKMFFVLARHTSRTNCAHHYALNRLLFIFIFYFMFFIKSETKIGMEKRRNVRSILLAIIKSPFTQNFNVL
jgi:hypothetical protein